MAQAQVFRIGTRGSPLALAQAHETRARLMASQGLPEDAFEITVIKTTGDRVQDRPLSEIGGKGLFTKEIEEALLSGDIDCAVHSMKDMPVEQPPGLLVDCYLPREDPRDAFLAPGIGSLDDLPAGAKVGSSSLRRRAQLLLKRPDLKVVEFRGNVQTRLRKLKEGVAAGTFLAMAGLQRLGILADLPAKAIEPEDMLPAVAQGAIGIEFREDDSRTRDWFARLNHGETATRLAAERAFLAGLDGSCQTPIAALALLDGATLRLRGQVIRSDGSEAFSDDVTGPLESARELGATMAEAMKSKMGPDFFA